MNLKSSFAFAFVFTVLLSTSLCFAEAISNHDHDVSAAKLLLSERKLDELEGFLAQIKDREVKNGATPEAADLMAHLLLQEIIIQSYEQTIASQRIHIASIELHIESLKDLMELKIQD